MSRPPRAPASATADSSSSATASARSRSAPPRTGGTGIRVHQDALTGERALAANAERFGLADAVTSLPLGADLVRGAPVVLLRLPRSLDALRDIAGLIAAHASPDVVVFAGGRIKHMTLAMNDVLREHFDDARRDARAAEVPRARRARAARRARSRSRSARSTTDSSSARSAAPSRARRSTSARASCSSSCRTTSRAATPRSTSRAEPASSRRGWLCGIPNCGSTRRDQSAVAVASARATAEANGVADRVTVVRDDALSLLPDASASFIALNPPFHVGGAIHEGVAPRLFADAARVLRPGGELWTVWNSTLFYRPALERLVGPTRQIARNAKFTVTASAKA